MTENQNENTKPSDAKGVESSALLALIKWARSGESTGGEKTHEVLKSLCNEIEDLQRWKKEALIVMKRWELVWEAAGRPGKLGQPISTGVLDFIQANS